MRTYSIGEVEKILKVKDYVIRYWEKEVPFLGARKGLSGRREYREREISLLLRLKHLLYGRRLSIEEARRVLLEEVAGPGQNRRAVLEEVREDLIKLYFSSRG
jgi:DNA-binding transcriptional MerR regulator